MRFYSFRSIFSRLDRFIEAREWVLDCVIFFPDFSRIRNQRPKINLFCKIFIIFFLKSVFVLNVLNLSDFVTLNGKSWLLKWEKKKTHTFTGYNICTFHCGKHKISAFSLAHLHIGSFFLFSFLFCFHVHRLSICDSLILDRFYITMPIHFIFIVNE